jgi:O-antigen/teichoic acid export membrane protein
MKPLHQLLSVRLAGWAVGGAGAHAFFGAISTIILARGLSPPELGHFGIFLAIAFLLNQMGDMGLGTAFVRLATPVFQHGEDARRLHTSFLILRLTAVASLGAVVLLAAWSLKSVLIDLSNATVALIGAGAAGGLLLAAAGHHNDVLRAELRHKEGAMVRGVMSAARAAAYGVLLGTGMLTPATAIGAALGTMAAEAATLAVRAHSGIRLWPPVFSRPERAWFAVSGWLFVTSGTGALITHTDTLLLGWLGGAEQTGLWVAGSRLVSPLPLVIGALWSVVLPISVALQQREKLERYLGLATRATVGIVVAAVFALPLMGFVIRLFFGAQYGPAEPTAQWLLLAYGFNVASILFGGLILRLGLERELAVVSLIQLAVNTAGDLWMIPRYGAAGCAFVTAAVMAVGGTWTVVRIRRAKPRLLETAT